MVTAPPFELRWDERGFLRQTSDERVRRAVVDAYASEHYQFITPPPGTSAWGNRLGDQKLAAVHDFLGPLDDLRVLEIGAGSSYVAARLLERFDIAEYVIVDPAIRAGEPEADRLCVIRDYFPAPDLVGRRFDVVLSFSCLEHVPDPIDFLLSVRRSLADDGTLLLTFPDVGRQCAAGDLNVLLHEHMSYLDDCGAAQVITHGGFRPLQRYSENDLFVYQLAKAECDEAPASTGPGPIGLEAFAVSLRRASRLVSDCLDRGERVAFHGANNGLNIFLHLLAGESKEGALIFDGDAAKTGHYLPACGTPIRAASDPAYQQVERVFVSAMSFYNEIRSHLISEQGLDANCIAPLFDATQARNL